MAKAANPGRKRRRQGPSPGDAVAREVNDILNKYLTRGTRGAFLKALGVTLAPVVEVLPSELPVLTVHAEHPDRLFRLADAAIVDLEFQMTVKEGDLDRFYDYQFAACKEYKTQVYTIVLYGPGIVSAPDRLDRGSAIFTVQNVFIGQWDGEAVLAELRACLATGADPSEELLTRLKLLPLMKHQRPLEEVVREAADLTSVLPQDLREEAIGTMLGLGYNYLDRALIDQLLREPSVANALEQLVMDSLVRGKAEGIAEGRIAGQHGDIVNILASRFEVVPASLQEQIMRVVDLPRLSALISRAATALTLEEFARALQAAEIEEDPH